MAHKGTGERAGRRDAGFSQSCRSAAMTPLAPVLWRHLEERAGARETEERERERETEKPPAVSGRRGWLP